MPCRSKWSTGRISGCIRIAISITGTLSTEIYWYIEVNTLCTCITRHGLPKIFVKQNRDRTID